MFVLRAEKIARLDFSVSASRFRVAVELLAASERGEDCSSRHDERHKNDVDQAKRRGKQMLEKLTDDDSEIQTDDARVHVVLKCETNPPQLCH